jgi:hypothetical protein
MSVQPVPAYQSLANAEEQTQANPPSVSFSSGVLGCFSNFAPSCLMSMFCLPFLFARLKAKTGSLGWPGKQWSTNLLLVRLILLFAIYCL